MVCFVSQRLTSVSRWYSYIQYIYSFIHANFGIFVHFTLQLLGFFLFLCEILTVDTV